MKFIIYFGFSLFIILFFLSSANITGKYNYIAINIMLLLYLISMTSLALTIIFFKKKKYKITYESYEQKANNLFRFPAFLIVGFLHSIYYIYRYYKYPIKIGMTDEDMINKSLAEKREKKLKKLEYEAKKTFIKNSKRGNNR